MTTLPRLHVITDDDVLARDRFTHQATALLESHGPAVALHLRGPRTPTRTLFRLAGTLAPVARSAGALFVVNDRADVALAVGADGVQLGQRSMDTADARRLRSDWVIGVSVHSVAEAEAAIEAGHADDPDGAGGLVGPDVLLVGSVWPTASHPGRPGAGLDLVRDVQALDGPPVIAIGGVTPERARVAVAAGAAGVAVLTGVWDRDPADAAGEYVEALGEPDAAAMPDSAAGPGRGARPRGGPGRLGEEATE